MQQYMVIEHIRSGCLELVYDRFRQDGRLLPDGLEYIDSWLDEDGSRCFQLMQSDTESLFDQWFARWQDLVDFELVRLGQKPV